MFTKMRYAILVVILVPTSTQAATLYVEPSGLTSGSCDTWSNACALAYALGIADNGDEVWVKAGTYSPITLVNGVKIIGGFAGTETAASQSNPKTNVSIIDANGSGRAVTSTGSGPSTMLRGFSIRNGVDDGFNGGGGILLEDSSAMIVQCVFEDNTAGFFGGAASVRGAGTPEFINCEFRNNGDNDIVGGGAVFVYSGSPRFTNCLFAGNKAGDGGAVAVQSGSPKFIHCTFAKNDAYQHNGGAIHDQEGLAEFHNCILWSNTAESTGAQLYNDPRRRSKATFSDVEGSFFGTGNIDSDPNFTDPDNEDFTIPAESPCANKGKNSLLPLDVADLDWDGNVTEVLPIDLGGSPRKIGIRVDMGAYEAPELLEDPGAS
jgi:hypothetical protein